MPIPIACNLLTHMDLCFGLLIMYRLTRLTISTLLGSLSRDTHAVVPVKKDLWASEQLVDLLEGQESGLGVEEVDKRNEASVENAEVDVCLPADARD